MSTVIDRVNVNNTHSHTHTVHINEMYIHVWLLHDAGRPPITFWKGPYTTWKLARVKIYGPNNSVITPILASTSWTAKFCILKNPFPVFAFPSPNLFWNIEGSHKLEEGNGGRLNAGVLTEVTTTQWKKTLTNHSLTVACRCHVVAVSAIHRTNWFLWFKSLNQLSSCHSARRYLLTAAAVECLLWRAITIAISLQHHF